MFICRLFLNARPFEQIEARLISQGHLTLGRDPTADWVLEDPTGLLSRFHCVLAVEDGRLVLYDRSTNGVVLNDGERVDRDAAVPLANNDSLRLGGMSILVEAMDAAVIDPNATALMQPGWAGPTPLAHDWVEGPASPGLAHRDASLLEAFCEGARLDASVLSSEDPVELMRRIGAVYQQSILGLAALMADRAALKQLHQLDRTTISARDNNPFKWSASRRLAEDLLCGGEETFLSGAPAVRACFEDLSRHMAGVIAGAETALKLAAQALEPAAIEAEVRSQANFLRGRGVVLNDVLTARRDHLAGGALQAAFAEAYADLGRSDSHT